RLEFDRLQVPYTYISDQVIRDTPDLREKFDVIIFPPVGGSAQAIVGGIPMRGAPIPWKGSDVTPNMGIGPDQSDDIRGGMTLRGVLNLQKFVEDGGVFIPITNCTRIAVDYGLVRVCPSRNPEPFRRVAPFTTRRLRTGGARSLTAMPRLCRFTSTRRPFSKLPPAVALAAAEAAKVEAAVRA